MKTNGLPNSIGFPVIQTILQCYDVIISTIVVVTIVVVVIIVL
jgi:hypothetical protein